MQILSLRLVNFRSYCEAEVEFGPGLNVVVGANATGKTNLLEAAWFALRGSSPRTRSDEKLVTWGESFARVEVVLCTEEGEPRRVDVGFAPRQGKRMRCDGVDVTSLDDLRARSQAFIFVPESLLLVKGSPARRRAHLDAFAAALDPRYAAAARALRGVLRQRNAQLTAVKNGASTASLDPWDVQFAQTATELGRRRRDLVAALAEEFETVAAALAPARERFTIALAAQLAALEYDEAAVLEELRRRRPGEISRGLSLYGPQRDDLRFLDAAGADAAPGGGEAEPARQRGASCGPAEPPPGGRDLRLFGSQGEQRAAVLALLLAEQRLATRRTGQRGPLLLDDVMSELDDARRRLLVRMLATAGQAIITTTNRHYFTDGELATGTVVEVPIGGTLAVAPPPMTESAVAPPPALDAL